MLGNGNDKVSPGNGRASLRKGISLVEVYGYEDIGPIYNDIDSESVRMCEMDLTYEDDSIYPGRMFESKEHFKITLAIHAVKKMFSFNYHRHEKFYTVAKCVDPRCEWRVTAGSIGNSESYGVKQHT